MAQTNAGPWNTTCSSTCDVDFVHQEKVERVQPHVPSREVVDPLVDMLAVLSEPTKLRILLALAREELCVCDIAYVLGMKKSATSHQLRLLKDRGMVRFRKEGRVAHYSLASEAVREWVRSTYRLCQECLTALGGDGRSG